MATTTNYSWTTPDDTDLVKDGAAAIRTLGSSIDTSVKALSPGTTAGDIDYYTTSTAKARVGIGTAGQVLTVNSGATAPEWAAVAAGGMTSLATGTLSGTTVSLTSISGSYIDLYLVIDNPFVNTASPLSYRFNGQTAGYNSVGLNTSSATNLYTSGGASMFPSVNKNLPTSTNSHSSTVYIRNYTSTSSRKTIVMTYDAGTTGESILSVGNLGSAGVSAITSIDIRTELGTPTFSGGTYTLYGVK
jgi:hypothetical protein